MHFVHKLMGEEGNITVQEASGEGREEEEMRENVIDTWASR